MIKLHARITREIEITEEQAERIVNYLCGNIERKDISDITEKFTEGIHDGGYGDSYLPYEWLVEDLVNNISLELKNYWFAHLVYNRKDDINL